MIEPTTGRDPHAVIVAAIHADSVSLRPGHPSRIVHWPGLLERERADKLARERDQESDRWRSEAEAHFDLRNAIEAEAAHWHGRFLASGETSVVAEEARDRMRALLDGPTPAPSATQPEIIGWEVLTRQPDGSWLADWDGETHPTREHGEAALLDAIDAGHVSRLARLVADDVPPDAPSATEPAARLEWGTRIGDGSIVTLAEAATRYSISPESLRVRDTSRQATISGIGTAWRIPTDDERRSLAWPMSPPSSPTTDQPAPGQDQDTTKTQEGDRG